jgi:hypothetical protein
MVQIPDLGRFIQHPIGANTETIATSAAQNTFLILEFMDYLGNMPSKNHGRKNT